MTQQTTSELSTTQAKGAFLWLAITIFIKLFVSLVHQAAQNANLLSCASAVSRDFTTILLTSFAMQSVPIGTWESTALNCVQGVPMTVCTATRPETAWIVVHQLTIGVSSQSPRDALLTPVTLKTGPS